MVQRVATVAFEGIEARAVDVQVQVAPGLPAFNVVGLPDKAVSEARERVRSALVASGLALPARRITVNLAPADLPKEGCQKAGISTAYRVPLLSRVPLNSKAYFRDCPTA
jgi:magnesium chelatase family protein